MQRIFLFFILSVYSICLEAQVYKDPGASVEKRVESLLSSMTLDEKLSYIGGVDGFYIRDIPRLGLPKIKMSDGPVGVRTWGKTTAYPAGICNAATWDKNLLFSLGEALGKDARARGVHILLAPGVNIYRAPMCGRNFEYFGEDPFLAGQVASQYIKGVQSEKVVATVKHFAGNNQEWNRYDVSSEIDERTLQEIYLPAFKAAVKDAKAGAVMNAYNLLNGVHCTQNIHLNIDILKKQWQFKGILMSDWVSTHDGVLAANGGLDLEMPSGDNMSSTTLAAAISQGRVTEGTIDDKVRRILRIIFSFGFYDNNQTDSSIPLDNPDNDSVSLQLARNGIVLLKNDSILPFNLSTLKSLAVIGPNADRYVTGGGSSYTDPFHYISVLKGITDLAGSKVKINFAGSPQVAVLTHNSTFYSAPGSIEKGLTGNYFNNQTFAGSATNSRIDTVIDFHWAGVPNISGIPADHFSIRWTGVIRPASSGKFTFYVSGDDGFRLWVGNQLIIDNWVDEAITAKTGEINLTAGQEYSVKLEYYENAGLAEIMLGYQSSAELNSQIITAASGSDAAVICVGFNSSTESEGFDRPFSMGADQDSLICQVSRVNPNTIVILNAGGNVDMQAWLKKIKGLIHAWYPGQNGGKAIAEILFGQTNPSGKLPVTFEKKWSDNPVYENYYQNDGPNHVKYNEGIFVGYRYYDANNVEPQFPFGFGLSYTTFEYSNLVLTADSAGRTIVNFDIKNNGSMAGAEVAQLYISPESPNVPRPVRELKDFTKVNLQPGETKTVSLILDAGAFSYFSTYENSFVIDSGKYDVIIGASSRDIRLWNTISFDRDSVIAGEKNILAENKEFTVYPNPASDYIVLQTNFNVLKKNTIQVFSSNGRLVDQCAQTGQNFQYNCSHLADGLYLFRMIADGQIINKKFLVVRR
jgi:beta-glucosidase